jgi:5-amino-6-(5-phosphoribosylamino)uracil reductase
MRRPFVLLSAAMSVDGCLDDESAQRLLLSGAADLDEVDEIRAQCDAIMVGAGTIRADNPVLQVRSAERRRRRAARGLPENPARVIVTASGNLRPGARVFTTGPGERMVYVPVAGRARAGRLLGTVATVISAGPAGAAGAGAGKLDLGLVLADLSTRGVGRLLVEGGGQVLREFLAAGLADELRLAIAPFFVGRQAAPRLAAEGDLGHGPARPMELAGVSRAGEVAVLRYLLRPRREREPAP